MSKLFISTALTAGTAHATNGIPKPPDARLWRLDVRPTREGFAPGPNGPIYWRSYGQASTRVQPVIVLHGGPAGGCTYMVPYSGLAADREVILYDQSGCGRSARPADLALYTVPRYVAELEALRLHLGYERMILVGHSWGALLAPSYAAVHPDRVGALVLAGGVSKVTDYQEAASRWLVQMGPEAVGLVAHASTTGDTNSLAYQAFLDRYYHAHVLRLAKWPDWINDTLGSLGDNSVYKLMNGPNEFAITGTLSSLDLRPAMRRMTMPVLVTCGEFDEAPPWVGRKLAASFPNARLHPFPGLSHLSHVEDPQMVIGRTQGFLNAI